MRHFSWAVILMMTLLVPRFIFSQAGQQPSTAERFIRLEEGQKAIEKRLEDTNKRIDDLRSDMNNLRSDLSSRIDNLRDDLRFWLGLIVTIILTGFGGLFGLWIYFFKNFRHSVSETDGKATTDHRSAELEEMQRRVVAIETQLKQMQSGPA